MNILISLLIFSLPFGVLSRINVFENTYIYLNDVFAGLIFLFFTFELLTHKVEIKQKKLFCIFLIFILVGFVSLVVNSYWLNNNELIVSFLYLFRFIVYSSLIFSIATRSKGFLESLNKKLVIAGCLFVFLGFVQFAFYQNLRFIFYAGWDEHLYRLFSTFFDPNFAGVFLVLTFILFCQNLFVSLKNKQRFRVILLILFCFLSLLAIFLTHSRSAFIALIFGTSTLLILHHKLKILIPSIMVLFFGLMIFSNSNVESLNPFRVVSSEARIDSAKAALFIASKNPILGVGFNTYRYAQVKYGFRYEKTLFPSNSDAGTDNSYLFVMATTGIVGFVAFIAFLFAIFKSIKNSSTDILNSTVIPSLISVLVASFFINVLFYPLIMTWIFILIAKGYKKQ